jgi:xenotropic and polytropic retrovirus receptor 1
VDPILRFSWVLLAVYTHNTDYQPLVAYAVAVLEITRRGLWCILRVENEHSSNVGRRKAHRDVPLPYKLEDEEPLMKTDGKSGDQDDNDNASDSNDEKSEHARFTSTNSDLEAGHGAAKRSKGPNLKSIAGTVKKISHAIADAHKEDFERKRKRKDGGTDLQLLQEAQMFLPGEDDEYASDEDDAVEIESILSSNRSDDHEAPVAVSGPRKNRAVPRRD